MVGGAIVHHYLIVAAVAAAAFPAEPWSVGPDGHTCVQLDEALTRQLRHWNDDPDNTMPDEGIWARTDPKNRRKMVLLFASKDICQAIVGAIEEEGLPRKLTAAEVKKDLINAARADQTHADTWKALKSSHRKRIIKEAQSQFAGRADRIKAVQALDALHARVSGDSAGSHRQDDAMRFAIWSRLFRVVFGDAYRPPRPVP